MVPGAEGEISFVIKILLLQQWYEVFLARWWQCVCKSAASRAFPVNVHAALILFPVPLHPLQSSISLATMDESCISSSKSPEPAQQWLSRYKTTECDLIVEIICTKLITLSARDPFTPQTIQYAYNVWPDRSPIPKQDLTHYDPP
mgnify:CR=1 FL=1